MSDAVPVSHECPICGAPTNRPAPPEVDDDGFVWHNPAWRFDGDRFLREKIGALPDYEMARLVAQFGIIGSDPRGFYVDVVAREGRAALLSVLGVKE